MIQFKNIQLSFDKKDIFQDFNLEINEGEKILLLAPSGKGKSSLVKMLLGFIKPDSGEIIYSGKVLNKTHIKYFRKNITYISQDVDLRNLSVKDLLKEIHEYKNNNITYDENSILKLFDHFELERKSLEHHVNELSGGERQRLGLIVCMLLNRPTWVLDEITSGLDTSLKERMIDTIMKSKNTVIIISHDDLWLKQDQLRIVRW
ncbi:ABC transporter ATP-binding protein [Vallitalea okinawensis]|uniref:ABC transporter ATP-binding protein n=1 Tax=Vallitalea okinawensis TaxID=2078660 RepID=UPI000CFC61B6|nr:ATP-binding cassette domain-containing protein [Vallitalea okinawensis]